jgi:hypothetical protein
MATANSTSNSGLLNLEKELVCFICTEVLYQPLTLIECENLVSCYREIVSSRAVKQRRREKEE